ncbi:MAG: SurA N-terminal domain-containing protein [Candidatus Omnitrophica bacterium]|nr:SurA N-terminal domain-containing protein [Candidatus Omnitrophota bacterium]
MKLHNGAASAIALFMIFLSACGGSKEQAAEEAQTTPTAVAISQQTPFAPGNNLLAAQWNGGKITLAQIDNIIGPGLAEFVRFVTDEVKLKETLLQKRRSTLDTLVENYLLIQEAHARDLQLSDVQKEQILKEARGKFNTEEEYQDELQKAGQTENDFIAVLTNIHLGRRCVEDQQERISETVNSDSLRAFYEEHIADRFTPPARTDINWVIIEANENRTLSQAKALAEKLQAEVRDKMQGLSKLEEKRKVIQDCAYQHSDHFTGKYNYGYMNLYHRGEGWENFSPEFKNEIVEKRKPGDLSDVVRVEEDSFGFFLVINSIDSFVTPFDSPSVQKMLPNMYVHEKMEEWRRALKDHYQLKIFEENLSTMPEAMFPFSSQPTASD